MKEKMMKLRDMLCKELDEMTGKGELSAGSLDAIHKLTDTIKNIDKIMILSEDIGYSMDERYPKHSTYDRDNSYDRDGSYSEARHSVRGNYPRDWHDEYISSDVSKSSMISRLEEMMRSARSDEEREALSRCLDHLKRI